VAVAVVVLLTVVVMVQQELVVMARLVQFQDLQHHTQVVAVVEQQVQEELEVQVVVDKEVQEDLVQQDKTVMLTKVVELEELAVELIMQVVETGEVESLLLDTNIKIRTYE
jgi:uncharacterized membrane protein YcjF (UPF0283 family)